MFNKDNELNPLKDKIAPRKKEGRRNSNLKRWKNEGHANKSPRRKRQGALKTGKEIKAAKPARVQAPLY